MDLTTLGKTGRIRKCFPDVGLLQIEKIIQNILNRTPRGDGLHNHPDRHARPPNAGLAAHHFRIDRNAR